MFDNLEESYGLKKLDRYWVTLFRKPADRLESQFRYSNMKANEKGDIGFTSWDKNAQQKEYKSNMSNYRKESQGMKNERSQERKERAKNKCKPHGITQKAFQEKFDEFQRSTAEKITMSYLYMHALAHIFDFFQEKRNGEGNKFRKFSSKEQCRAFSDVMNNIVENFAVVGVIERMNETLAVLHCRFPWMKDLIMPHKNPTTDLLKKIPLKRNDLLMQRITETEDSMYEIANKLLTIDVQNCRARQSLEHNN